LLTNIVVKDCAILEHGGWKAFSSHSSETPSFKETGGIGMAKKAVKKAAKPMAKKKASSSGCCCC
jgi:hypothetical protein